MVTAIGARPVAIDPGAHDRLVALTSHLPHVVANLLASQAGAGTIDGHDPLAAAGGSFRDMTRVAGANPRIWIDIFLDNREALLAAAHEHRRRLDERHRRARAAGDAGYLARFIGEAAGARRRSLEAAFEGVSGDLHVVRVHVPDRPGVDLRHRPGAGRRADQHRGLRAAPHLARAGRHRRDHGRRHRRRRARRRAARRPGLRRHRDQARSGEGSHDRLARRGHRPAAPARSPSTATSRSRTARCWSARSARARCACAASAASADTHATLGGVRALGVQVDEISPTELVVHGVGLRGPGGAAGASSTSHNSGTLLRLLPGLLAGQPEGTYTLDGDESIRRRPVDRVAVPLRRMGAVISSTDGCAPMTIDGGNPLTGIYVRAARRLGPGEVVHPARRPAGGGRDDGRRAARDARPHRAHAARRRRARGAPPAAPSPCGRPRRCVWPRSRCPGTSRRPRSSSSPPRWCRSRTCSSAASASTPAGPGC